MEPWFLEFGWSTMVLLLVLLAVAFWMWWRVIPTLLLLDDPSSARRAHHDPLGDSLRLRAAALQQIRIERRIERDAPRLVADVERFLRQQVDEV
ncbi:MAG: hypothetical protein AAFZ07_23605 [Actinomycetota bacterium]